MNKFKQIGLLIMNAATKGTSHALQDIATVTDIQNVFSLHQTSLILYFHCTRASKPRGNDAFCVIGNVGGAERCCHEVRFETRRFDSRP